MWWHNRHHLSTRFLCSFHVEGEPPARAEAATADGAEKPQEQPQEQEAEESEAAIVFKLYELLRAADMEVK